MDIKTKFDFLISDYGLTYRHQRFNNCYGGHWKVETYSFYNDSGCFTIYFEIQRGIDFWYASEFCSDYEKLCEKEIDISIMEPQIWNKYEKIWIFKRPFFWWNNSKVLSVLAEVLKIHLSKNQEFFGVRIDKTV